MAKALRKFKRFGDHFGQFVSPSVGSFNLNAQTRRTVPKFGTVGGIRVSVDFVVKPQGQKSNLFLDDQRALSLDLS